MEKAESTGALPNPVIISVRSKRAFQLIDVTRRDQLVDDLNARLRVLHWHRDRRKAVVQRIPFSSCERAIMMYKCDFCCCVIVRICV